MPGYSMNFWRKRQDFSLKFAILMSIKTKFMHKRLSKIYFGVLDWRDKYLSGMAKWLISIGITANQLTFFRLFLVIPMVLLISFNLWAVILILALNDLIDGVDGVVARKSKSSSKTGRVLDVTIDNFYVIPLVFGLIWFNQAAPFWAAFYIYMVTVDFFLNYFRFSFDAGKFPYSFSKYFVYLALLIMALGGQNYLDLMFLFWSVVLLILNVYSVSVLYKKHV